MGNLEAVWTAHTQGAMMPQNNRMQLTRPAPRQLGARSSQLIRVFGRQ
jgi:hypothetical protein